MKNMNFFLILTLLLLSNCGSKNGTGTDEPKPNTPVVWTFSPETLADFPADGESQKITITTNTAWKVTSDQNWCITSASGGFPAGSFFNVIVGKNPTDKVRTATLTFTAKETTKKISVKQTAGTGQTGGTGEHSGFVPTGYNLVWWDEFNDAKLGNGKNPLPNESIWWYETGASGWGNNEIQNYVPGFYGTDTSAVISNGTLKIIAKKRASEVISIRMNSKDSWLYGYFEARMKMPVGKGTWPAFWMMPKNFNKWPDDGEIDIMEFVGYEPNVVHSTVHTAAYNHSIGTQKGNKTSVSNASTEFHVYSLEWTPTYIKGFADGKEYFKFSNDNQNNKATWPFNAPFYLKLNMAWGGNWGGAQGIDPAALPATYEIDYVRVYQK